MDLFAFDKIFYNKGLNLIAGIDEAGRGPLAGPVVASAVILPKDCSICGLNDSKKLSCKKRELFFKIIKEKALFYAVSIVNNDTIDRINILQATLLAMKNSILQLPERPDVCLIDGNCKIKNLDIVQKTIIGGDARSAAIAAASILAKVTRDSLMGEYSKKYPLYGFEKHKGYGTKKHIEAINQYGVCPIHRMSFAPICSKLTKI
jgi:ribonuclease HII